MVVSSPASETGDDIVEARPSGRLARDLAEGFVAAPDQLIRVADHIELDVGAPPGWCSPPAPSRPRWSRMTPDHMAQIGYPT